MFIRILRTATLFVFFVATVGAFAQSTVTLQDSLTIPGFGTYGGTTDTRIASGSGNEGSWNAFALIEEASTSFIIRFNIFAAEGGPVPNGATINSAMLSFYKFDGPASSFKASRLLKNWTEMGATWTVTGTGASWTTAGAMSAGNDYLSTPDGQAPIADAAANGCMSAPYPAACWLNIDVTSGVQAFASGSATNYGWKLADTSGQIGGTPRNFNTRDNSGFPALRPKLTVTYTVPPPPPPPSGCNSGTLRPYDGAPISGNPITISASNATTFEAEHFNCGGQNVAYHDNVAGNAGGAFRTSEDVDIIVSTDPVGGDYVVNNFETGEWLYYSLNVPTGGNYLVELRASNNIGYTVNFHIEIGGQSYTIPVTGTGSWNTFNWFPVANVSVPAGNPVLLKLVADSQWANVNQIRFTPSGTPPPGPGGLIFKSGFEGTTSVGTPYDCYNAGCYQNITGQDGSYTWPPQILGGSTASFQACTGGGNPTPSTLANYIVNEIQAGAGRNGSNALYMKIQQEGGPLPQDPYIFDTPNEAASGQLYQSFWIKLQPELGSLMAAEYSWRVIYEWKSAGDYRISLNIRRVGGVLRFEAWADNDANGGYPYQEYWKVPSTMTVPIDTWFKVEVFFKRSSTTGVARTWMAVNGQKIADCPNSNVGVAGNRINRLMALQLYSGSSLPIYQWIDDFQLWSDFPSVTDDPPYGPSTPVNTTNCTVY
jgi:hypothetical protein